MRGGSTIYLRRVEGAMASPTRLDQISVQLIEIPSTKARKVEVKGDSLGRPIHGIFHSSPQSGQGPRSLDYTCRISAESASVGREG